MTVSHNWNCGIAYEFWSVAEDENPRRDAGEFLVWDTGIYPLLLGALNGQIDSLDNLSCCEKK